jgi:hypothetical protein
VTSLSRRNEADGLVSPQGGPPWTSSQALSSAAPASFVTASPRKRPALRPLALPAEHGGWGILLEPIVLGLAVAPSWGGVLIGIGFLAAFLTRHPLKLALQDAFRGRSYSRTNWCRALAAAYGCAGIACLTGAFFVAGPLVFVPLGLVAPMALTQIAYDARNRSRSLLAELAGAAAMSSSAAAIALAGGFRMIPALAVSGIVLARSVTAIVYVRALLARAHGQRVQHWPVLATHAVAVLLVALFAPRVAFTAMVLLFARAIWGLFRPVPPAKTIGWTEIAWGFITVIVSAVAL